MKNNISYVIVTKDCSAAFTKEDEQINLMDVFTLEDCQNAAADGIEIILDM